MNGGAGGGRSLLPVLTPFFVARAPTSLTQMTFEWDVEKAAANLKKHKVAFSEAVSIMFNPLTLTFPDPAHSIGENREISIGYTITGLLVFVSHTQRGEKIRVISARSATPAERKRYEKGISN